jgi:hypothetical protein
MVSFTPTRSADSCRLTPWTLPWHGEFCFLKKLSAFRRTMRPYFYPHLFRNLRKSLESVCKSLKIAFSKTFLLLPQTALAQELSEMWVKASDAAALQSFIGFHLATRFFFVCLEGASAGCGFSCPQFAQTPSAKQRVKQPENPWRARQCTGANTRRNQISASCLGSSLSSSARLYPIWKQERVGKQ